MKTKPHWYCNPEQLELVQCPGDYSIDVLSVPSKYNSIPMCLVRTEACDKVREFAAWVLSEIPTVYVEERVNELLKLLPEVEQ